MFSYPQIARWLTFPIDPITIEDWVANREVFGPFASAQGKPQDKVEQELEMAYQIESARGGKTLAERKNLPLEILLNGLEVTNLVDEKGYLLVAPVGKVGKGRKVVELELLVEGVKPQRVVVVAGDIFVVPLRSDQRVKLLVKCGPGLTVREKRKVNWSGSGKTKIVVDGRGRPLPNYGPGPEQRQHVAKLRQLL